ncbi:PDR/VanB family oxidoreductase [soil metagenome]
MDVAAPADTPMPLRIERAYDVAEGIRSFELMQPDGSELPAFTPGSHVKVLTPSGAVRKYSLCNAPSERHRYVISVKRDDNGQGGSLSLHTDAHEGDALPTSKPDNAFEMVPSAKGYLFIAGGIGITPILSMIRSLDPDLPVPWKLVYMTRSAPTTAFIDELKAGEFAKNVRIHHDGGNPDNAFDLWPVLEKPTAAHIYCCGPRPLMEAVRDMSGHWSSKNVHFESFNEGGGVRPDDKPFRLKLARTGLEVEVPVGKSILNVIREHGVKAASSCESGTCGTCRTALLGGEADHRDMVLMPDEFDSQIMICVSRAKATELVIDL